MDSVVSFKDVCFSYGEAPVLRGVSFEVMPSEFIGIIGPNGGGKTTILRLAMGFLEPQTGKIKLFDGSPKDNRHNVAYVPQSLRFDKQFPISVMELVLSGLLSRLPWYGMYSKKDKQEAAMALERMGIEEYSERAIGTLSGGQIQRALIARALVSQPKLLLLDEPTANVDAKAEADIYRILKELSKDISIMMVTHDLKTSIDQVDRVLCVQGTVASFKAKEVCEHFALGLYHAPLLIEKGVSDSCCQLQVLKDGEASKR